MPDLTPEVRRERVEQIMGYYRYLIKDDTSPRSNGRWEAREEVLFLIAELDRVRHESHLTGRKQGWQDAGLSLDAQEVLAASLTNGREAL